MNSLIVKEENNVIQYDKQLISTLRSSLYPGAKEESVIMVIEYCRHAKLDVMLKPVHVVPMWIVDKETSKGEMRDIIMPGINLYRIQASRSGCAGISEPEFGEDITERLGEIEITYPKWCRVTVKRIINNQIVEFSAKEYWKENYANAGKDKATGRMKLEPNAMWSKRPYGQLAKCAEAQALRKAFPEIGAQPTAEEMEGKQLDSLEYDEMQKQKINPGKGIHGLKEIIGMAKQEEKISDINPETGEIIETVTFDIEEIKWQIETATSMEELSKIVELVKELPNDVKKEIRKLYKERADKLGAK